MRRRVASNTVMRTLRQTSSSPTSGNMAQLAEHEAADGVEVGVLGQFQAELLVDLVDVDAAQRFAHAVVQPADRLGHVLVVFIDDLAHDLLQHVFHGHQAGDAAVFVQHQGHLMPPALKVL